MTTTPGGSVQAITIKNRRFPVQGDNDPTINIGGMSNEVSSYGDGTAQVSQTRNTPQVSGLRIGINHDNDDMAFLQGICDSAKLEPFTIQFVSGHVYQGKMIITDLPGLSPMSNSCEISLKGEKKLELQ